MKLKSYLLLAFLFALPLAQHSAAQEAERPHYSVLYTAWIKAGDPVATVRVRG